MQVMTNQNTGSSAEFKYVYGTKPFNIFVTGVFDTATLTLEAEAPDGSWIPVDTATMSAPTMKSIDGVFPFKGRFTISGESLNTSLTVEVVGQIYI